LQFVKAGGKCDPVDSQIFTFLLSFLRHHRLATDIRLGGGWLRDRVGPPTTTPCARVRGSCSICAPHSRVVCLAVPVDVSQHTIEKPRHGLCAQRHAGMRRLTAARGFPRLTDTLLYMHTAQGSVFGQLLSDYARKRKQQKTGETPSRAGLRSCFRHPTVHSLPQAGQSTQGEGVKIVARGDKWTMWFLGRELRFEKRMADTWGDEARWRLVTLFASFVTSRRIASRHEPCIHWLTLPTPHNATAHRAGETLPSTRCSTTCKTKRSKITHTRSVRVVHAPRSDTHEH
jgi:hypothetical protein